MAFNQQSRSPARPVGAIRDWRDMPEFPVEFTVEAREAWKAAMNEWWRSMKSNLQAVDEDIDGLRKK